MSLFGGTLHLVGLAGASALVVSDSKWKNYCYFSHNFSSRWLTVGGWLAQLVGVELGVA